jgi:hypothetical protein
MKLKNSSVIVNPTLYTRAIRQAVDKVYLQYGLDPVCTSGNDGAHMPGSMHGKDRALDIRFWDLLTVIGRDIKAQLPDYYDVVIEKDHFHIEADQRREPEVA